MLTFKLPLRKLNLVISSCVGNRVVQELCTIIDDLGTLTKGSGLPIADTITAYSAA